MQASLVMFKANGERKDFPLTKSVAIVGRKNTCDLRIPLGAVSRQHFQIEQDGGALKLKDLGSSNGTYHNGERVLEAELEAGDKVQVGPVTFIVEIDGMPKDIEPVKTVLPEQSDVQSAAEVEARALSESADEAVPDNEASDFTLAEVDEESHSPTMEFDDDDEGEEEDPIAALEALAGGDDDEQEDEGDDQSASEGLNADDAEDGAISFLEDEEEEKSR